MIDIFFFIEPKFTNISVKLGKVHVVAHAGKVKISNLNDDSA